MVGQLTIGNANYRCVTVTNIMWFRGTGNGFKMVCNHFLAPTIILKKMYSIPPKYRYY